MQVLLVKLISVKLRLKCIACTCHGGILSNLGFVSEGVDLERTTEFNMNRL